MFVLIVLIAVIVASFLWFPDPLADTRKAAESKREELRAIRIITASAKAPRE